MGNRRLPFFLDNATRTPYFTRWQTQDFITTTTPSRGGEEEEEENRLLEEAVRAGGAESTAVLAMSCISGRRAEVCRPRHAV